MTIAASRTVAHFNLAVVKHGLADPRSAGFTDNLDKVNAAGEGNDPELVFSTDPNLAMTLSTWASAAALKKFGYRAVHGDFVKRRTDWFETPDGPAYVDWKIGPGTRPTLREAKTKLSCLAAEGGGEDAFEFGYLDALGNDKTRGVNQ